MASENTKRFRFGIFGSGTIAHRFVREVAPIAEIHAVASRRKERAEAFARQYEIAKAYGDYAALLADPEVDAVYIATPAPLHRDHCLMCIEAGKAVLCEKPFTTNAAEAVEIAAAARSHNVFCMEAMWMRFNPLVVKTREWIRSGRIGSVQALRMEIGFRQRQSDDNRMLDPALGGGALLDLGVYGLSLANYLLGTPNEMAAFAKFHPRGVDNTVTAILAFPEGLATLTGAIGTTPPNQAVIMGSEGRVELSAPFFNPGRLRLTPLAAVGGGGNGQRVSFKRRLFNAMPFADRLRHSPLIDWLRPGGETVMMPRNASGFRGQASEVIRCLGQGRIESEVMPLDDSIAVMRIMDQLRQEWPKPPATP